MKTRYMITLAAGVTSGLALAAIVVATKFFGQMHKNASKGFSDAYEPVEVVILSILIIAALVFGLETFRMYRELKKGRIEPRRAQ